MLKKTVKLLSLGLAVAITSSLTSMQLFGQNRYAANVPLSYTMVAWEATGLGPDDTGGEETIRRGARRGDGSSVLSIVATADDGVTTELRGVFDLTRGRYYIVDSVARSVTTTGLEAAAIDNYRERRPGCDGRVAGSRLGYDVVLTTNTPPVEIAMVAKHGYLREETFAAPALGCLVMETNMIMTYPGGAERVVRSERVIDVRVGAPDASLFAVPADYKEMSPVERLTALGRGAGLANDLIMQTFESNYQSRRAR